jgi:hypothetical protein
MLFHRHRITKYYDNDKLDSNFTTVRQQEQQLQLQKIMS